MTKQRPHSPATAKLGADLGFLDLCKAFLLHQGILPACVPGDGRARSLQAGMFVSVLLLPALYSLQLQGNCGGERPGSFRAWPGLPGPLSLLSWEERLRQTPGCAESVGVCNSGRKCKVRLGPSLGWRARVSPWASGSASRQVRQLEREARKAGFGTSELTGCDLRRQKRLRGGWRSPESLQAFPFPPQQAWGDRTSVPASVVWGRSGPVRFQATSP